MPGLPPNAAEASSTPTLIPEKSWAASAEPPTTTKLGGKTQGGARLGQEVEGGQRTRERPRRGESWLSPFSLFHSAWKGSEGRDLPPSPQTPSARRKRRSASVPPLRPYPALTPGWAPLDPGCAQDPGTYFLKLRRIKMSVIKWPGYPRGVSDLVWMTSPFPQSWEVLSFSVADKQGDPERVRERGGVHTPGLSGAGTPSWCPANLYCAQGSRRGAPASEGPRPQGTRYLSWVPLDLASSETHWRSRKPRRGTARGASAHQRASAAGHAAARTQSPSKPRCALCTTTCECRTESAKDTPGSHMPRGRCVSTLRASLAPLCPSRMTD